jgi:hypothetical protein
LEPSAVRVGRRRNWLVRGLGVAFVALGFFGAAVWVWGLSPVGFERIDLGGGAQSLRFDTPGEFVVFEERDGGSSPRVEGLVVQSRNGERLIVSRPAREDAARTRPFLEAWEVGAFRVRVPGVYTIYAVRPGPQAAQVGGELLLANARSAGWLGSWLGLVALGVVPVGCGVAVLVGWRRGADVPGGPGSGTRFNTPIR